MADRDAPGIIHNQQTSRFELVNAPERAHLNYYLEDRRLTLVHTEVADEFEGQGIGSTLVRAALIYADEHDLAIVPVCPFVTGWLERHPDRAAQLDILEP